MATAEERIQSLIHPWHDSTQAFLSGTRLTLGRTQLCSAMHPEILTSLDISSGYHYTTYLVKCSFQGCDHKGTKLTSRSKAEAFQL